ncbi:phage tail tape measure protein [Marinobacterium stanieri]|uniref:Phage tail tape measure protein, TP901 family, core region n=1 Tax=Marinobacterium stanieri TaxID=49186 RepID=A0A1N6Q330_9GAMM|nr:phage tail tape measure protein [Marinobacterium stanieri]SIQ11104.1 phage tail tape measure protein, TP901 family, core region [Marinobacterium stanieri]
MARDLRVQLILDTINKASAPLKAIGRDSGKTAEALKASQEQLKILKRQQRDISSFQKLESATRESGDALREQQQKAAALAREMRRTANPTKKLQREFEQATSAARRLKDAHQSNRQKLQQLGQQLRQNGIHTDRLDRHQNNLQRQMRQTNGAIEEQKRKLAALAEEQKRLNEIRERANNIRGNAMTLAGHSTAALGSGVLAMRGMSGMMAPVVEAQTSGSLIAARHGQDSNYAAGYTAIINAIKANGSVAEVNEITTALDAASAAFGTLGDASSQELQRISRHALNLSSTFGTDTAESIQVAQIMLQNGLAGSADEAFDLITGGMQNVTAEMRNELPEILHEYSTHFRGLGFSGQESMNLLVKMAAQGKFALDKTGDAIKEFSIRGSDMSKASVEAYDLIGLNAQQMSAAIASGGDDAQQALQTTVQGLLQIPDPAERANAAIALFGTPVEDLAIDKIPDFLAALGGAKDLLGDTSGAAANLGKQLRNNLNGDIGKLSGSWNELKTQLFDGESSGLRDITQQVTGIVRQITGWARENPELASTLVKLTALLAVLITVLGALGLAVSSVMFGWAGLMKMAPMLGMFKALGPVLLTLGKTALPLVAGGLKAITTALIANPIGLAVTAIAGLAYLIYRNWEPIKAFFAGLWQQVKAAFNGGISGVAALLANWSPIGLLYKGIRAGLSALGIELPATFSELGGNILQGLINGITKMIPNVKEKISSIGESVSGWFKGVLGIHSPSRVFASHGGDVMAGLQQGLGNGESGVMDGILGLGSRLIEQGKAIAGKLGVALGDLKNSALDKLKAATGWLGEQLGFNPHDLEPVPVGAEGGLTIDKRPPLQGAGRQPQPVSNTLSIGEIHVHAAPGMDGQAVAHLVALEIQKLQLKNKAASRSSFNDED